MSSIEISILIPSFNEEESLRELYDRIITAVEGRSYEIIFVDDGSTDKSIDIFRELNEKDENVHFLRFRRNYGKSAALSEGFRRVKGEYVITMDADLQDDPKEIPQMIDKLHEGFDLVSGWKKNRLDPISKTLPSKLFNKVTSLMSGIKIHDFNCGLKAYRKAVVKDVEVYGELHRYIPVLAKSAGYRVCETVVTHHPRKHGYSKFGASRFFNGLFDLITVLFLSNYRTRPMHLFGWPGAISLITGTVIELYLAIGWFGGKWIGDRPIFFLGILLIIVGGQFISIGLLGELLTNSMQADQTFAIAEEK